MKAQQEDGSRYFLVFFTKDVNKKKKVFTEGVLASLPQKVKLFTMEGEVVNAANQKSILHLEIDEEYLLGHNYLVVVDKILPHEKFTSGEVFIRSEGPRIAVPAKGKSKNLHSFKGDKPNENPGKDSIKSTRTETEQVVFPNGLMVEREVLDILRPHQVEGVKFMFECVMGIKSKEIEGCILADFMGLGKTLQTLTLLRSMIRMKILSKIIVVTPLTLVSVWEKECEKWFSGKLSPLVCLGATEEVAKTLRMFIDYEYRMLILSY